jgi:hypothetical protein
MKIYIIPFVVILGLLFASCESDYLDKMAESDGYDDPAVFQDSVNFKNFNDKLIVTPLLKRHRNDVRPEGDFDDVSDNSISGPDWTGNPSVLASTGNFYQLRNADQAVMANTATWARIWSLVRVANVCIENIDQFPGSKSSRDRILGTS